MKNIWQIAAGESGRYYDDLFLEHDIMFLGPGEYGKYSEDTYREVVEKGHYTSNKIGQIRRFVNDVTPGDVVLLRRGYVVAAVGLVPEGGKYDWSVTFDDIYGWDLHHFRRVLWQDQLGEALSKVQPEDAPLFAERKQIPTFTAVNDERVLNRVTPLLDGLVTRDLKDMPKEPDKPLDWDQLAEKLFSKGVAYAAVDNVIAAVKKQRQLGKWYDGVACGDKRPTEHEVVAHLILPLMKALGWSEQLLAVEWNKIDLAVFQATPRTPDKCALLCEAKSLGHGLQNVLSQARDYCESAKLTNCVKLMLTDGRRIYLYERDGTGWRDTPTGYFNVDRIRTDHIAPRGTNAIDTLVALTPAGIMREIGL